MFLKMLKKIFSFDESRDTNIMPLKTLNSSYSMKNLPEPLMIEEECTTISTKELEANSLRLSSHQITLLRSSIWAHSISPANMPENYEAIANTSSLVLLFSRAKNSSHEVLVRSFQLAFSLRSISLNDGGSIPPSRCRSLFILATSMILFSLKAYNIVSLVHVAKAAIRDKMVDPFLRLVEDHKLQAVNSGSKANAYGSKEDDGLAMKSLSEIQITEDQTREFFASEIVKSLEDLSDSESSTIRQKLLNDFIPDDVCPLGSQLFLDTPEKLYQVDLKSSTSKEAAPLFSIDEDSFANSFDSHKNHSEFAMETPRLLSVNQLLESVSETTHLVGRVSVSTGPDVPYKEMALHCEALLMGKQKKMSGLISGHQRQECLTDFSYRNQNDESKAIISASYVDVGYLEVNNFTTNACKPSVGPAFMLCTTEYQHHPQFFKLPASSPYDNFLKAAGC